MGIITDKIVTNFLKFEEHNNPKDILFNNQVIWPTIRYAVFYYLLGDEYKGIQINKKFSFIHFLKSIFQALSFRGYIGRADVLVFDVGREKVYDNEKINPLVFTILETLGKKYKITVISEQYKSNYFKNNKKVKCINIFLFKKLINFYLILGINKKTYHDSKNKLSNLINHYFKKKIDIDRIYKNIFLNQRASSLILKIVFFLKKPKIIIYSDNANMSEIIFLAKKKNILTIDYQHSVLSDLNILYIHNKRIDMIYKNYLSDYIFIWGDFWKKFYSDHYKICSVGNFIHEYTNSNFINIKKNKNCITIISSIISRKILIDCATLLANTFPQKKIIFKLKPMEFLNWKDTILAILKNYKNIEVIDNDVRPIEFFLKQSMYVIGTNSTALIEAMPYAQIIVIKHGWYKEMQYFIENNYFYLATDIKELINIINNSNKKNTLRNFPLDQIFKKNSFNVINDIIDGLLSNKNVR